MIKWLLIPLMAACTPHVETCLMPLGCTESGGGGPSLLAATYPTPKPDPAPQPSPEPSPEPDHDDHYTGPDLDKDYDDAHDDDVDSGDETDDEDEDGHAGSGKDKRADDD